MVSGLRLVLVFILARVLPELSPSTIRGCTLGGNFNVFKGRKSVMLGVWAVPGAAQTHKMIDFRFLFFW